MGKMNYVDSFKEYLKSNGYTYTPEHKYRNPKNKKDRWFDCVEARYEDETIQAFVLMSDEDRKRHPKYPFYRSYKKQIERGGVTPASYVATYNDGWHIYNASATDCEVTDKNIIDYEESVKRYLQHKKTAPQNKTKVCLRAVCWITAALCFAAMMFLLFKTEKLTPESICAFVGVIVALILFPILFSAISSIGRDGVKFK